MDTKKKLIDRFSNLRHREGELGIEIEMEGLGLEYAHMQLMKRYDWGKIIPVPWDQKGDGSLRGESCEWVLNKPLDFAEACRALDQLYEMTKEKGVRFTPSRRCGIHIHVNVQQLTSNQIFNYICLYLIFENVLLRWAGEQREGNFFCLRADDAQFLTAALADAYQTGQIKALNGDQLRYAALNVYSLFVHGSLEFRSLPTVTMPGKIKTWARLLLALKEASLKYSNPKQMVVQYGGMGPEKLMAATFGTYSPLQTIPDKAMLMKSGLRNLQDVMMTKPRHQKKTYNYGGAWQGVGESPHTGSAPEYTDTPPEPDYYEEEIYDDF